MQCSIMMVCMIFHVQITSHLRQAFASLSSIWKADLQSIHQCKGSVCLAGITGSVQAIITDVGNYSVFADLL